jgi:hypothetical protein
MGWPDNAPGFLGRAMDESQKLRAMRLIAASPFHLDPPDLGEFLNADWKAARRIWEYRAHGSKLDGRCRIGGNKQREKPRHGREGQVWTNQPTIGSHQKSGMSLKLKERNRPSLENMTSFSKQGYTSADGATLSFIDPQPSLTLIVVGLHLIKRYQEL